MSSATQNPFFLFEIQLTLEGLLPRLEQARIVAKVKNPNPYDTGDKIDQHEQWWGEQPLVNRRCTKRSRPGRSSIASSLKPVAGPRLDPDSLPRYPGLEVKGYVHNLYEHLAAADLGVVQGGVTTTMELTINRRPFIYFPLKNHCEQEFHVAHWLDRYRAGTRLDYTSTSAEKLAEVAST